MEAMKANIREAIEVYIDRVNGTPAMGTTIQLFPGVDGKTGSWYHIRRPALLTFLKKGAKAEKEKLKADHPDWYQYFEKIWKIRNDHIVASSIPTKYCFLLKCCGSAQCLHPSCTGKPLEVNWFAAGPSIGKVLPTPVIELVSPDGKSCSRCDKACAGHYKTEIPTKADTVAPIPSVLIAAEVEKDPLFNDQRIKAIARDCIVPPKTVLFYVNHLKQVKHNRARGAVKAAQTKLAKKNAAVKTK